ncbi:hypothetical protein SDC9_120709 [bioreactor metagenome]|uniref:Uncharacterized protein n=1 Tax=bioreactor metagenome TaxID=1076179 RepID=A0A645C9Y0_9ZZZZ
MHFDTIAGKWKWIKTYKVIPLSDTNPETPANTGIEELLVFNTDFTWYKTQNNVLADSGSYSLGSGSYTYPAGVPTLEYDSIAYYRNNTPIKNGFDYYEIYHDTLVFCSYFGGRWSAYTLSHSGTKWWIRQN